MRSGGLRNFQNYFWRLQKRVNACISMLFNSNKHHVTLKLLKPQKVQKITELQDIGILYLPYTSTQHELWVHILENRITFGLNWIFLIFKEYLVPKLFVIYVSTFLLFLLNTLYLPMTETALICLDWWLPGTVTGETVNQKTFSLLAEI